MTKFKAKTFEIEAVQFTGSNWDELVKFTSPSVVHFPSEDEEFFGGGFTRIDSDEAEFTAAVYDYLHNTWVKVKTGQWIIKGNKGEFYPCDDEIFRMKYEETNE